MTIERIGSPLNRDELEKLNKNLETLGARDHIIMQDFLNTDPGKLTPGINGVERPSQLDLRNLNDFGVNFRAGVNGIIHKVSIYADRSGQLGIGLAEQEFAGLANAELYYKVINLRQGWNEVDIDFPIEQGKRYTLFRRNVSEPILTAGVTIRPWNAYPFLLNGIDNFGGGKYLNQTGSFAFYNGFFEIQVITSLAQVYKIANDSVRPPQQFYVGSNPPQEAQFWFKPVGDS